MVGYGDAMQLPMKLTSRLERFDAVDRVAGPVRELVAKAITAGPLKDALSGTWLGHPFHPLLIAVPIGSFVGTSVLDLTSGDNAAAARRLVGLGVLSAVPTAASGLSDWSDTTGAEQRVGAVHAALNLAAVALYGASWVRRRRGDGAGTVLALAGGALVGAAGYLGGHLSYALGVGVDTNAFQVGPTEWQAIGPAAELGDGRPHAVSAGGVSLLVVEEHGRYRVLDNRCSHRGAPLSDGEVADGCVTCPWHDSTFDLATGSVRRGPATQAQPVYETRVVDGMVEARRDEPRSLRANPVGSDG